MTSDLACLMLRAALHNRSCGGACVLTAWHDSLGVPIQMMLHEIGDREPMCITCGPSRAIMAWKLNGL